MLDSNLEKDTPPDGVRKRGTSGKTKSQINAEYFQALEQWLNDVRPYTYSCSFLAGLPYTMMAQQMYGFPSVQTQPVPNFVPPTPPLNQGFGMFAFPRPQPQTQVEEGVEYKIPPLWKRFVAEFVDFMLLFMMKLVITFIAVDFFDFVDLDKYDIDILQQQEKMDYKLAIEMTSEILFLEMIHRLIVCVYEGISLHKGIHNQIGGATPGKTFMGIRVVLCNNVQQVENQPNVVKVFPATNLGLGWSFARAFLKNLVLALLFPVCFPLFFNKYNRTGYDILCHSIVVEDRVPQQQRNR